MSSNFKVCLLSLLLKVSLNIKMNSLNKFLYLTIWTLQGLHNTLSNFSVLCNAEFYFMSNSFRFQLHSLKSTLCLLVHPYEWTCLPQDGRILRNYSTSFMMSNAFSRDQTFTSSNLLPTAASSKRSCLLLSPELRSHIVARVRANPCALNSPLSEPRTLQPRLMDSTTPVCSAMAAIPDAILPYDVVQCPTTSHSTHPQITSPEYGVSSAHRHSRRRRPRRRHAVANRASTSTTNGGDPVDANGFGLEQLFAGEWWAFLLRPVRFFT